MVEAKSIETLSLAFTAGIAVGTLLPGGGFVAPTLLLSGILLPCLICRRRPSLPSALPIVIGTLLLLGVFCAWNAALPGLSVQNGLERMAEEAVLRLRALIGGIPFPSEGTAPLLLALLTGDRGGLPPETVHLFRQSGASHLLALSGLHVGIIYLIFNKLTYPLGNTPAARKLRFFLIVTGAGFFTLMTGAGPSIVRAFLFIAINETLRLTGRPRKAVRVLCLALLVQLVLAPSVIRSIGFQLSYLAMAGIFLLYPVLEKWYPPSARLDPLRKIWNLAALSISCQLFTAPLAWLRFHSFPRFFLLTNLLAIPGTTGLMGAAVATVALSAAGVCPDILIKTTDGLGRLLLWILETISSLT